MGFHGAKRRNSRYGRGPPSNRRWHRRRKPPSLGTGSTESKPCRDLPPKTPEDDSALAVVLTQTTRRMAPLLAGSRRSVIEPSILSCRCYDRNLFYTPRSHPSHSRRAPPSKHQNTDKAATPRPGPIPPNPHSQTAVAKIPLATTAANSNSTSFRCIHCGPTALSKTNITPTPRRSMDMLAANEFQTCATCALQDTGFCFPEFFLKFLTFILLTLSGISIGIQNQFRPSDTLQQPATIHF